MKFRSLASSSAGCAYHLSGGGASSPILIDCGLPLKQVQKAIGFKVSDLAGCIISHAHADHIQAAKNLMNMGVKCYASSETWQHAKIEHFAAKTVVTGAPFMVGDWKVNAFLAEHDMAGTYGFVIDSPNKDRLLYLTDSCFSRYTFRGLTHIAIEANFDTEIIKQNSRDGTIDRARFARTMRTHMSIETLIELLKANDLSKLKEIHLLHLSAQNSNAQEFKRRVAEIAGVPVFIAGKSGECSK